MPYTSRSRTSSARSNNRSLLKPMSETDSAAPADRAGNDRAVSDRAGQLATQITERIRRRLGDRINRLQVLVDAETVVLQGTCATYYSKQLAQHAALGAIEDEQLENAIEVCVSG